METLFFNEVWQPPFTKIRQQLISRLEEMFSEKFSEKVSIISYIQNTMNPSATSLSSMNKTHESIIYDAIKKAINNDKPDAIAIIINSLGGDPHMVDNLVRTIYEGLEIGKFYTIIPHLAKSAASLLALSSDKIIGGPISELGPVDPQLVIPTQPPQLISCNSIRRLFENTIPELTKDKTPQEAALIYSQLPILLYQQAIEAIEFTKNLVDRLVLKKEKVRSGSKETFIKKFLDEPLSHGEVIKLWDLTSILKDDSVLILKEDSEEWKILNELYARSVRHLELEQPPNAIGLILIESKNSSFSINVVAHNKAMGK